MSTLPISVPSTASSVAPTTPFEYGEDYAFYDARTKLVPDYYQRLLASATKSIEIWDTYTRVDDWQVFKDVRCPDLTITINTIFDTKYLITERDVKYFADAIKKNLHRDVAKMSLRVTAVFDKYRYEKNLWHDRFLIIDDTFYYLVGPSVNNQYGSSLSFGIHQLSKVKDIELLKRKLQSYSTVLGNSALRYKVSRNRP